jgi:hypothetical protein
MAKANGRTGCGQQPARRPERLACTPLLTADAGGAGVDAACQWRDVAAASTVPSTTTALAGVVADMGGEGLEKGLAGGISQLVLYR